jgi:phosphoglycolate phosphatase
MATARDADGRMLMTARQLAIFDFDGTVADSADWFFAAWNEVARRHRLHEISVEEREMLRGQSSRRILAHMGLPAWRLPAIANELRKLAARDAGAIRPFSWVPDIFARLRDAGVTIAIVSSNTESNIRRILGPVATSEVGHYATGASLYGKATKIRQVIRKAGSTKAAAVAIGDEVRDVEAAREAGIASLAVAWGFAHPAALRAARPTALVEHPSQILGWFLVPGA